MITKVYEKFTKFIKENYKYLLFLLFIFALFRVELPYKIYTPGGMVNLEKRINVEEGYSSDGTLGMAYVSMVNGSIPFLLLSYVIPNWDIVSNEDLVNENESLKEMIEADKIAMKQAMDNATKVSYEYANKEFHITKEIPHITYIDEKAKTDLKILDIILSVDDEELTTLEELKNIVSKKNVGDTVKIKVLRDNEEQIKTAEIYDTEDGPKIGIAITTTYEFIETPKIEITAKQSESGPSGGLMMSLAIYNSLVPEDITKGKKIIGTGTIDEYGNVGEIGGVKYKLLGASKKKCDVFIVPKENYDEAVKVKEENNLKINVIGVSTFEEALTSLKQI